jgi:hypothetical protein
MQQIIRVLTPLNLNSTTLKNINPFKFNIDFIFDWIDNSKDPLKAFLIWELCIILVFYIILIILPDQFLNIDNNLTLANMSAGNIIKLRKVASKHVWTDLIVNINNKVFSRSLLENIINQFWNKIEIDFKNNNHMYILFKIKYINGEFSSIGKVQRLNLADKNWYIDFIIESMKFKSEYYNETQIESINLSYGFKEGKIKNKENPELNVRFQNYKNYNLPISTNPLDYGRIIIQNNLEKGINYILQNDKGQTINLNKFETHNEVEFFNLGISLVKFEDNILDDNKFLRIIGDKNFYFENNEQILFTKEIKTKFISKTKVSNKLINNFITLDIETFIHENSLYPYLISFYDGKKSYTFGLWDYEDIESMILDCLNLIMSRKYNGYKVYVHNLAKFDVIFLLKYLVKIGSLQPIIHNDKIISLIINYGKNSEYKIEFKDSLLILTTSLLKLCKAFNIENGKSLFPHLFVNENNLNYIGKVPNFKFFKEINLEDYNNYKSNFKNNWNLKNEAIKYCEIDCTSLYQVIYKFNEMIFNLFSLNIHRYPTLPSLAFAIFRSSFMEKDTIPQLSGKISKDIRSGYTGGSVEVYIPKFISKDNVKMKCLDVNSLYPSQMEARLMPIGTPTYFEGNIRKIDPNAFGFFYCEIIAPEDIKHPILQTHVKTKAGVRTIAPIGSWEDIIFSSEMDNAIKYGYKFNILWGYTFEKGAIFKDYVNFLFKFRSDYPSSHPLNYIAKLLLNSLYGRFGMDDNFNKIIIIHKDYLGDFENKFIDNIVKKEKLDDYFLITFENEELTEGVETHNVSISIAAAITAYSRIHMSFFKNNPNINLYYTDTDSAYTDSEIDESLINSKVLGKMKLENICDKAIFLTPKVYCLVTESGKTIYKVKGLSHDVNLTYEDFEKLLNKDVFIEKTQTKWFRKLSDGKINLVNEIYTLEVNDNKRELIYNKNNVFIGTKPYKISKDKIIK